MSRSFPLATRARAARSTSSDRRTGRRLLAAYVLARTSLLVLTGRATVDAVCEGLDRHRIEHRCSTGRRLDVVIAAREAVTDVASLQQQRTPWRCPSAQRECTAVTDQLDPPNSPLQDEDGRLLGVVRTGSAAAARTMSSTLVVAGLIGLLGVHGPAASVVHSFTGPVRRAVRVLQAPETGRRRRPRPTTFHALRPTSRAADTAGADLLGAAREIVADATTSSAVPEGPTATSEVPVPARVIPSDVAEARTAASTPAACSVATTRYVAARSRALGPTTALWHAVQLDRLSGAIGGACETTVCGSLVRVSTEQRWPVPARDVCPTCSALAH